MAVACERDLDALLVALTRGLRALVPIGQLSTLWGLPADHAIDLAAELEQDGWLSTWEPPDGPPCVILSTRAAERLGLELEPQDTAAVVACRWVERGASRPPAMPLGRAGRELLASEMPGQPDDETDWLDQQADPAAIEPAEAASRSELLSRSESRRLARLFPGWHMPVVLGMRLQWPAAIDTARPCPGCGGSRRPGATCVVCDDRCKGSSWRALPLLESSMPARVADLLAATETAKKPARAKKKISPPKPCQGYRHPPKSERGAGPRSYDLAALRAAQERGRAG